MFLQVDKNSDNVLSRQEFHDMINRNRIRNPSLKRGEKAFKKLDRNKVSFGLMNRRMTEYEIFFIIINLHYISRMG